MLGHALAVGLAFVCAFVGLPVPSANAHAALTASEPADGAVVAAPPSELTFTFNEPVSALVLRLIGPDGSAQLLPNPEGRHERVAVQTRAVLATGTHALSWRVVSLDGHPVGGTIVFSVGAPSSHPPPMLAQGDRAVAATLWATKIVFYVGLFVGIGGSFFAAWITKRPTCRPLLIATSIAGIIAAAFAVALQGLDALGVPLPHVGSASVWRAGVETSFGATAIIAISAFAASLLSLALSSPSARRVTALAGMIGTGLALAFSGHASAAAPELLMRPAVFVHAASVSFWIGSLAPLISAMRDENGMATLARFSRLIPWAVGALVLSGAALAIVQVQRPSALATSAYGEILFAKLVLVTVLLALAAWNRRCATPAILSGVANARGHLRRSIVAELVIVLGIFALVASWRFTPPPRSLALAAEKPALLHIHTGEAMADVRFEPGHAGIVRASIVLMTGDFGGLDAKEVQLAIENKSAGVEAIVRPALKGDDAVWRVEQLSIPQGGRWDVRLDILVDDFQKIILEGRVDMRGF